MPTSVGPSRAWASITTGRDLAEALGLGRTVLRAENNLAALGGVVDPRKALEWSRHGLALARRLGIRSSIDLAGREPRLSLRQDGRLASCLERARGCPRSGVGTHRPPLPPGVGGPPVATPRRRGDELLSELETIAKDETEAPRLGSLWSARAAKAFAAVTSKLPGRPTTANPAFSPARSPRWRPGPHGPPCGLVTVPGARDDLAAVDASGVHGPAVEADRRTIQAGLAALDGHPADALRLYREALRTWHDLGLAWDEALCQLDMVFLLDPDHPEVQAAAESAREILTRLGAKPFLARLDARVVLPSSVG